MEDYFRRTGRPGTPGLDAAYQYQTMVLRDLLERLEVILDDEHLPEEMAKRVLRCMLYGSPSVADAELRIQQTEQIKELLERTPVGFPVRAGGVALNDIGNSYENPF